VVGKFGGEAEDNEEQGETKGHAQTQEQEFVFMQSTAESGGG
jgi:hypothetical protein